MKYQVSLSKIISDARDSIEIEARNDVAADLMARQEIIRLLETFQVDPVYERMGT